MEEVDNIIIDSLRNLHCNIDEDIRSLKEEFTAEMAFDSIVSCLEAITPGTKFPHKLPPSMSLRLKLATNVAEHIKELGYRDDMGYQTILYCNEVEIRKVLMFLVERLPRETSKTVVSEDLGYVSKLVKEIEERIKLSFKKPWVPSMLLKQGVRSCATFDLRQDLGYSYPLHSERIEIPNFDKGDASEALKQYWVHNLPNVTDQCPLENLVPSLLYKDSEFSKDALKLDVNLLSQSEHIDLAASDNYPTISAETTNLNHQSTTDGPKENKIEASLAEFEETKRLFQELHQTHKNLSEKLLQMNEDKSVRELALKDTIQKVKTKSKTLTILSNEDNFEKLKQRVDNGKKRLIELGSQWHQVQEPLLKQYEELKENLTNQEHKVLTEKQKLQNIRDKHNQVLSELNEKEKLEQHLTHEYQKLKKHTNRSAYTRRILEIIGNIKKQNEEIQKILKDTKEVQKEINNLNGQLDRSFTLSDELIFRDAKREEMARKAYKLLVTLHSDCGIVIQAVTDLGLTERERRNLQEQIDAELAKGFSIKLEKVTNDLLEVKKEIAALLKQSKEQV